MAAEFVAGKGIDGNGCVSSFISPPRSKTQASQSTSDGDDVHLIKYVQPSLPLSTPTFSPFPAHLSHNASPNPNEQERGTDDDCTYALQKVFGHPCFRQLQRQVVTAALQQLDVFVLMPTGGGKSICYQVCLCCVSFF